MQTMRGKKLERFTSTLFKFVSVIILVAYYFTKMMKIRTKGATVHQNPSAYFVIYLNSFIYVIKILSGTHKTCH